MASWEPATSAVPGGFSKQNKVLAKISRFPSGICVFHSSIAALRVLLDIPVWDFDWQLIYEPTESIVIDRGDTIRIECTWDRALRDPLLEPAYVLWADGTDDEMCFSTVVTRPV